MLYVLVHILYVQEKGTRADGVGLMNTRGGVWGESTCPREWSLFFTPGDLDTE